MFSQIKKIVTLSILLTTPTLVVADNSSNSVENNIKNLVSSRINIEVVPNKSIIQTMVFNCDFYTATPYFMSTDGGQSSSESFLYYHHEDALGLMTIPYTTEPLPELSFCLKPDFRVNNKEQAQLLFEAIETVYPAESMFDDRFEKQILKVDNGWMYINGEFFDDKKGYIAETSAQGKVIKITRSLNL